MVCSVYFSRSFVCVVGLWFGFILPPSETRIYTNQWAVRIPGGSELAQRVAAKYGYTNLGQVGGLKDHYLFSHGGTRRRALLPSRDKHSLIATEREVEWVQQQVVKRRVKREHGAAAPPSPSPNPAHSINLDDLEWSDRRYKLCRDEAPSCHSDMNITGAWGLGYTGKGVVVTILDDGIKRNHADLTQNYDTKASYDVIEHDDDPMPPYDSSEDNNHGTRCAGVVAASTNNSVCGVGVAFNAKIGGVRLLDGAVTDAAEAWALSLRPQHVDVYIATWGPEDDGQTVDGPATLASLALESGVRLGRKGRGSIFVWASGNGGRSLDHCSCDGYASSIYTVSVSSAARNGSRPRYLEECASTLCAAYGGVAGHGCKIVTSDLQQGCTDGHTGTSVSASIAAGIISLTLEANSRLSWRDVQHIIVRTSRPAHLSAPDWHSNGAGYRVSHLYGFGLMDAEAMVREAEGWTPVPSQHTCVENTDQLVRPIPLHGVLRVVHRSTGCSRRHRHRVGFLEHVVVKATIVHPHRGRLSVTLISPAGTKSQLLNNRPLDRSADGFQNWEFMTTHCWGERAAGNWTLEIRDSPSHLRSQEAAGELKEWSLVLYGTSGFPYLSVRHQQLRSAELPAELPAEDDQEYSGPCDPECDEFGCEGPGPHQCIGCLHHFLKNRNNIRTCVSACPSGFFADSRGRCKKCYFLCETCVGSRRDQCTSCKPGYHSQEGSGSCVSSCADGYYLGGSVCMKCSENCVKCTSSEICTECAPDTSLHGSLCHRSCEPGSFYSRERKDCEACDTACASCTGKGECSTCAEGFLLEDRMCVPSCNDGFYPVMHLGTCSRCEPGCLTCAGPGGTCTSCVSGLTLQSGACILISDCRDGEYQDESGGCHLCDLTCDQCRGPESWDCISCTPGRPLEEGRCDTGCSPGKYASEGRCQLCDVTCGECSGGGPENCTACEGDKSGTERFLFRGRCVDVCPEGTFRSAELTCDPCPEGCGACSGPDRCTSCNSSSYRLRDGVCTRLECGEGEVEDPEYGECMVCEEGCRKCVLYNPRHCLSCAEGFYQFQDTCLKTCPAKTYSVEEEMTCLKCSETCVSCDAEECFWCEADLFLSDAQCVEQCEEGYYGDEESQECERCHDDCKTCSGPDEDDCDSCEEELQLAGGECVREEGPCPSNSFFNDEGECESCHSSCESCWGKERNQCSTCGRGRFLTKLQTCVGKCPAGSFRSRASRRCESCPPGCALCDETGTCLRCHSGRRDSLYLQEGQCVRQCQRGYPMGQVCQSCASACASCEGNATRCLSCVEPFVLHGHSCAEDCPPGHLPREGRCHPCPPACRRCTADNLCVECEESHVLHEGDCVEDCPGIVRHDGKCLSECPGNTYHDVHTGECKGCEDSCLTCVGPGESQCSSCRERLALDDEGRCVPWPACPPSSYRDPLGHCQPCPSPCASCLGPGKLSCLSCNHNHFLLNGSCVDGCPLGLFRDTQHWRCERCHPSCHTCVGQLSQHCITCAAHLFRQDKLCLETCPPSFYGNVSTGACEPCAPGCGECSGGGAAQCLTCLDGRPYLGTHGHCRPSCPPGRYLDARERTCESCHPSCRTCTGEGFMACDSCHGGYSLSGGMCESPCITGQYPVSESATLRCERCDASCLACKGPGSNNCTLCPAMDLLTTEGRCLPCCENETRDGVPLPECCNCTETRGQCVLSTNFALRDTDDSTGSPTLFITTMVLLLLGLGAVVLLIWRGRSKRRPEDDAPGYEKLGGPRRRSSDAVATPRHRGLPLVDLTSKDDDDDDDEDIVYMSRDGTVYRKFNYGQPGDREEGELEFSTRKYTFL